MPQFNELPRPILLSISALSGDTYSDVEGDELLAELEARGVVIELPTFLRAMERLRDDGYVSYHALPTMSGATNIRLEQLGRIEVEGWPASPGEPSEGDVEALLELLAARSEDPALPEHERGKARAARVAVKELGVGVAGSLLSAWLKHAVGLPSA